MTEHISVQCPEDVTQGGGALFTIVVRGLVFLHQAVPVPDQPGEPGLASS